MKVLGFSELPNSCVGENRLYAKLSGRVTESLRFFLFGGELMSVQSDDLKTAVEHAVRNLRCAVRNLRKHFSGSHVEYPEILVDHPIVHLDDRLLQATRCYASRESLLKSLELSKGIVAAEIGTSTGAFAQKIISAFEPEHLDLVDIDFSRLNPSVSSNECVHLHEMRSAKFLENAEENFYDFVYIDADHSYKSIKAELKNIRRVMKPGSLVMFNDYTRWSITEVLSYGVLSAVNEFAVQNKSPIVGIALTGTGHFDICLKMD